MQQSGGSVGHSKHRKAFVHGQPGRSSKGKRQPLPWIQKFFLMRMANAERFLRQDAEMYPTVAEAFAAAKKKVLAGRRVAA